MELNDDIWLKQWRDNLDDFEEEVPVDGWERLQADLQANDPLRQNSSSTHEPLVIEMESKSHDEDENGLSSEPNGQRSTVIPFRRWQVAAAAAVVVLIAGAGIWFLTSDKAPQVPTIEAPIAQIVSTDNPEPVAIPTGPEEKAEVESSIPEAKVKSESQPSVKPEAKPAVKSETKPSTKSETKPVEQPVVVKENASQPLIAQATVTETPADETKREGTPIQVRTIPRNQMQRSAEPMAIGNRSSQEVNTINRRQIRFSQDERMKNVPLLRGEQAGAVTRSVTADEITDVDRVFNSFTAHIDELYNEQEHLFDNGTGDYNTLDNALFLAGLVKKMQGQHSAEDVRLYRDMAKRLVELQQPNGLWKSSLLDPTSHSANSDTDSYICYALAWGVNNGILNRSQYVDSIRHAWQSIDDCNSIPCRMAKEQMTKLK